MTELEFHLDYFDGPLDLLLHLIKDSKIDIESVFLSDVTEQYLKYMEELNMVDMETQSEFLSVASTLLEIKSKALLPKYEDEPTFVDDDANELLRRLEEYKIIKNLSKELKSIEEVGKYYKTSDPSAFVDKVIFAESDVDKLLKAFNKVMTLVSLQEQKEQMVQRVIPKDTVTVEMQQDKILTELSSGGKTTFFKLVKEKKNKMQLVTMLLAILELIKNQVISIKQSEMFDDIDIELKDNKNIA